MGNVFVFDHVMSCDVKLKIDRVLVHNNEQEWPARRRVHMSHDIHDILMIFMAILTIFMIMVMVMEPRPLMVFKK